MSDVWKQCEGQVIDNRFRLLRYLGGTDDSAVFLTQLAGSPSQKAAIKFIPAGTTADLDRVIDNRFRLLRYLGGTDDSAVFLTQLAGSPSQKAAIKFIPAGTTAD